MCKMFTNFCVVFMNHQAVPTWQMQTTIQQNVKWRCTPLQTFSSARKCLGMFQRFLKRACPVSVKWLTKLCSDKFASHLNFGANNTDNVFQRADDIDSNLIAIVEWDWSTKAKKWGHQFEQMSCCEGEQTQWHSLLVICLRQVHSTKCCNMTFNCWLPSKLFQIWNSSCLMLCSDNWRPFEIACKTTMSLQDGKHTLCPSMMLILHTQDGRTLGVIAMVWSGLLMSNHSDGIVVVTTSIDENLAASWKVSSQTGFESHPSFVWGNWHPSAWPETIQIAEFLVVAHLTLSQLRLINGKLGHGKLSSFHCLWLWWGWLWVRERQNSVTMLVAVDTPATVRILKWQLW